MGVQLNKLKSNWKKAKRSQKGVKKESKKRNKSYDNLIEGSKVNQNVNYITSILIADSY